MKLYEYEAKKLFREMGIPTPAGVVVRSPEEAIEALRKFKTPAVVKAQVLTGGRGKAGGIRFVTTPEEAAKETKSILEMKISDFPVVSVLIEEKLSIAEEFYVAITVDREQKKYVAILSSKGGIDIESIARGNPKDVHKVSIDPILGFHPSVGRALAKKAGLNKKKLLLISSFLSKIWRVLEKNDAELVEINPAILTTDGKLIAADAKMVIDSNALFRQQTITSELEGDQKFLNPREIQAKENKVNYVELEGEIGIIGNGAGLVMATMDAVSHYGGKPANFLDVGGGASAQQMSNALEIVTSLSRVKAVLINILGGVTRGDEMANGIIDAMKSLPSDRKDIPLVIRLVGTREKEGREILTKAGIKVQDSMEQAAKDIVRLVEEMR
ncbi:MAG: ADP-forming succinate--CoA ligase subunit beta [Candidatus Ranarchaeia archaeon]